MKYLNVLKEPNFINEITLIKKYYEKIKLNSSIQLISNLPQYLIKVHRFKNFNILAQFVFKDASLLKNKLVKEYNKKIIKKFAKKKMNIIHA